MIATRTSTDAPWVLADRLTAAAWRLAGAHVVEIRDATPPRELEATFDAACTAASSVLLERGCAERLATDTLAARVRAAHPLVASGVPDVVRHARRVLGVGT